MRIVLAAWVSAAGLAVASCGEADATTLDPANPLHCAVAFEAYTSHARQLGNQRVADGLDARTQWYAARAKTLPEGERTPELVKELTARFLAEEDGGMAVSTECFKRQDADPSFQALLQSR